MDFHEIQGVSSLWTRKESTKFQKWSETFWIS